MTQEQKDILLKDLCARLMYGVKVKLGDNPNIFDLEYRIKFAVMYGDSDKLEDILDITNIRPYLFPISSMTDEQKEEHKDLLDNQYSFDANGNIFTLQDFYCKYHLDFRGLIDKMCAIDATGLNIY